VVGIMAVGFALLAGGALSGPSPNGPSRGDYLAFSAALAAISLGFVYWRCYRAGLYPQARHTVVVNVFWTYRVPWSEIESFSVGPTLYEYRVVLLERSDGTTIPITATAGWAPFLPDRFVVAPDPIADELNTLLAERKLPSSHDQSTGHHGSLTQGSGRA
jgi:hypothetical protein